MRHLIRDQDGNVYGPADPEMLRDWVQQGRIVAGMFIAPENTREWIDAAQHPAVADLLQVRTDPTQALTTQSAQSPYAQSATDQISDSSYAGPSRTNTLAMLSMIFGCISVVSTCGFCIPVLTCILMPLSGLMSLTAIVLGAIALYQIKQSPGTFTGKGMAIAGIVMGAAMMFLGVVVIVIAVIVSNIHP